MDEDETSLFNRNLVLDSVKDVLIKIFGNKIVSAIVYGSTLNEDFCIKSDYDILLVVIKSDLKFLKDLRGVKIDFKNRGVEIDSVVADGPQSCILKQVENGVFMRMAILEYLMRSGLYEKA